MTGFRLIPVIIVEYDDRKGRQIREFDDEYLAGKFFLGKKRRGLNPCYRDSSEIANRRKDMPSVKNTSNTEEKNSKKSQKASGKPPANPKTAKNDSGITSQQVKILQILRDTKLPGNGKSRQDLRKGGILGNLGRMIGKVLEPMGLVKVDSVEGVQGSSYFITAAGKKALEKSEKSAG